MPSCSTWRALTRNGWLWALLLLVAAPAVGQTVSADSSLAKPKRKHRWLYRERGMLNYSERALGLWSSVHTGRTVRPELGLVYGGAELGEYGGTVSGLFAAYEFSPNNRTQGVRLGGFGNITVVVIGVNAGASAIYYWHEEGSVVALRPEIGLGAYRLYFNYARNFFLSDAIPGVQRGMFSVSFYLPLVPWNIDHQRIRITE